VSERVRHFQSTESGRLDRVVATALPELSRAQARKLVEGGHVSIDGASIEKPAHEVAAGLDVRVVMPVVPQLDLLAAEVPLEILYEDEETLVINKAAGLIVHPAPGVDGVTLVDVVRARYPEVREIDDSYRTGIVHRLDRDTSGVMALAKSAVAQELMKDQWREREPVKVYLAIAEGRMDPREGIIEAPLGADPSHPSRRAVLEGGQSARSQFRTLEQFGDEAALLEVRIFTGRTHQIRVHLQAIGHAVVGDFMYGQPSELIGRQALHASRLTFRLASTGETRTFEAPPAPDFASALETLRARHDSSRPALESGSAR